jgi:arylsulfatase A-like enzyme
MQIGLRRATLASFTLLLALLVVEVFRSQVGAAATEPTIAQRPNILFIFVDDLGYGDVGVFWQNDRSPGQPALKTANLDRLAAEGIRLTNHYCASPVCAPSRGSLMQGLNQGHCAIRDNQFDKPLPRNHTLATVLRQAGYDTAAVGKWGLGGTSSPWPGHPLNRGFNEYYGFLRHGQAHDHYAGNRNGIYDGLNEVEQGIDGAYDSDLFTARAKKFIVDHAERRSDQPFFLYLAYTLPHMKMRLPPGPYPDGLGLHGGNQWPFKPYGTPDSYIYPEFRDKNWPENEKRHASMIHRLDDCIGDVLQLLKDLKIDENTLIVFSSDNGPHEEGNDPRFFASAGPFDGIKRDLFEGGSREPTIVRWPGHVPTNAICDEPSAHYDWMATLAEVAGVPAPGNTDGISLLPVLTGHLDQQRHHPYLYSEYLGNMSGPISKEVVARKGFARRGQEQAIRVGDFVAVRYDIQSATDPLRLYNLAQDPHEDHDLSQDPAEQKLLAHMRDLLVTARTPNPGAPRPYDLQLMPAVEKPSHEGMLSFRSYTGHWPWLPDLGAMTPEKSGEVPGFVVPGHEAGRNGNQPKESRREQAGPQLGVAYEGFINVPTDGEYTFSVTSDSGVVLWLHDSLVVDDDYTHDDAPRAGIARLKAGWHPIRLFYRHEPAEFQPRLRVAIHGPSFDRESVEADMLGCNPFSPAGSR